MFEHQREEAQNGGCSPEFVLNYLEIWLRHPSAIYVAFSRGLGDKKTPRELLRTSRIRSITYVLKVKREKLGPQIGNLEKRLRNGWRKRRVTLGVSHKARP